MGVMAEAIAFLFLSSNPAFKGEVIESWVL